MNGKGVYPIAVTIMFLSTLNTTLNPLKDCNILLEYALMQDRYFLTEIADFFFFFQYLT